MLGHDVILTLCYFAGPTKEQRKFMQEQELFQQVPTKPHRSIKFQQEPVIVSQFACSHEQATEMTSSNYGGKVGVRFQSQLFI